MTTYVADPLLKLPGLEVKSFQDGDVMACVESGEVIILPEFPIEPCGPQPTEPSSSKPVPGAKLSRKRAIECL